MPRVTGPPASACSTTAGWRSSCCKRAGLTRIAYVDIDAHHGDGVFYAFEDDPTVIFADLHEDGRYLYPGTGMAEEIGKGAARGMKLNVPLPPGADDQVFAAQWPKVIAHLEKFDPQFVILQCGADSLEGDPITHLRLTLPVPWARRARAERTRRALGPRAGPGAGRRRLQPPEPRPGLERGGGKPAVEGPSAPALAWLRGAVAKLPPGRRLTTRAAAASFRYNLRPRFLTEGAAAHVPDVHDHRRLRSRAGARPGG